MSRKTLYKLELAYVKYSPMIISLVYIFSSICCYYDLYLNNIFGYLFGTSIFTVGHLYISSISFKFCKYHRMFIHYIVVVNALNAIDYFIGIPISDRSLFITNIIVTGVFLFLILYYYNKCK